jgi:hypothetical protein
MRRPGVRVWLLGAALIVLMWLPSIDELRQTAVSPDPTATTRLVPTEGNAVASGAEATPLQTIRQTPGSGNPTGTTRFVASQGSDGASGAKATPFQTIQHAVDVSLPGDTIRVGPGNYEGFAVGVTARADAPLTIQGSTAGATTIMASPSHPNAIRVTSSAEHITLERLTITGSTAFRSAGLLVESVLRGPIVLRNLRLIDNAGFGAHIYGSRNVLLESSEVSGNGTGVQITGEGSGVVVRDDDIHDNNLMIQNTPGGNDDYGAVGVTVSKTAGPVLIAGNRIWGNRAPSYDYGWDGGAFEIFGASGVTMRENTMWDNEDVLETGTDGTAPCSGNSFVRNVAIGAATAGRSQGLILRCGDGMLIAHNTLTALDNWAFLIGTGSSPYAGSIQGARIMDNIVALRGQPIVYWLGEGIPANLVIDSNLVWNPGGAIALTPTGTLYDLGALRALGYESVGIQADPRFDPLSGRELRLSADSPAIDSGATIDGLVEPFAGAAPDIGRWEAPGP